MLPMKGNVIVDQACLAIVLGGATEAKAGGQRLPKSARARPGGVSMRARPAQRADLPLKGIAGPIKRVLPS